MKIHPYFIGLLAPLALPASPLHGQGKIEPRRLYPKGPYVQLTDNYRDQTNFNVETVRGLAIAAEAASPLF